MTGRLKIPSSLKSRERFIQFAIVGGLGFLVDQSILILLIEYTDFTFEIWETDLTLEMAKLIAAETAIIVMFIVNDRWTFQAWGATNARSVTRRLVKSNLVRVGGLVVATVVLSILVRQFGLSVPVANAIGILSGFLVNYTFETLYTWRLGKPSV